MEEKADRHLSTMKGVDESDVEKKLLLLGRAKTKTSMYKIMANPER